MFFGEVEKSPIAALVIIKNDHFGHVENKLLSGQLAALQAEKRFERTLAVLFLGPRNLATVLPDVPVVLPGDNTAAVYVVLMA